ncbi:MAG: hypothetical protein WBA57_12545 [Elainellaceae cyanobacterium]
MTWFTVSTQASLDQEKEVSQNQLVKAIKWFWRFSNFYGEYNSLPPSQRRNFVDEQVKARDNIRGNMR